MVSEYEKQRELNIQRNKLLLKQLGLDAPFIELRDKSKSKKAKSQAQKRKVATEEQDESEHPSKVSRTMSESSTSANPLGLRRSARNAGKNKDYQSELRTSEPLSLITSKITEQFELDRSGKDNVLKRRHDPKVYGQIPGVEVGSWWETRQECSNDSVHAPWVAGISAGSEGAYSVALSGGYDDDIDLGYAFTYTGSGGRDLKGTKDAPKNLRTGPQRTDQTFDNPFNRALERSSETKKPVRVIRGYKLQSRYAPAKGYRYDGLYTVEKAWMDRGLNPKGYLVCKFAFKRIPGQSPLPVIDDDNDELMCEDNSSNRENKVGEVEEKKSLLEHGLNEDRSACREVD